MELVRRFLGSLRPSQQISYSEAVEHLETDSNSSDQEFTYEGRTIVTPVSGEKALEELRDKKPEQVTYISKYKGYRLKFEYGDRTEVIETIPPRLSQHQIEAKELAEQEKRDIKNRDRYYWT